ncbi:MAG: ribokinase [Candidatus Limnocylindria bacterium]
MSPRAVVVGSYVAGLTVRSERLPAPGETLLGEEFDLGPGGKGSNQAVQIARMGMPVEMVTGIGVDAWGDDAMTLWETEGVGTAHVRRVTELPTGVAFILLDRAGTNSIIVYPGANAILTGDGVAGLDLGIGPGDVVLAQLEIPADAAAAALRLGRDAGATTILNPAPVRPLPPEVLATVDVLTPNATEGRVLTALAPEALLEPRELVARLLDLGVGAVVLTLGEEGALVADAGGITPIPPIHVDAVDTTGAGDAFTGALAAEILAGRSLREAAATAVVAGALACTELGVIPGLARRAVIEERRRALTTFQSQ